jgi:general secretion pathway protein G
MLVLGIIAVLVGSAIYMLVGNIDVAKEQRVDSDIEAISMQLRTYEMLNYRMPTTEQGLKALVNQPTTEPRPRRWKQLMKTVPIDPWGNEYVYRNPGKGGAAFDIYSLGPDGKESDDDAGKNK